MTDLDTKRQLFRDAAAAERDGRPMPPPLPQPDGDATGTRPAGPDDFTPEYRDMVCACGETFEQSKVRCMTLWMPQFCSACRDRQAEDVAEARRLRLVADAARQREERVRRSLESLAIRPKYAAATVANFAVHGNAEDMAAQGRVLQLVRRYLAEWPNVEPILAMIGHPGTGKGHLAWAIAKDVAGTHGASVQVVKLADMVRRLRATWRKDGESEEDVLAFYRRQGLLVIDEVSTHAFYGQNVHQHLYDVLDDRLEHQRPTILTSNENDEGLAAILRPALWDRLHDGGGALEFTWGSWRSRERAA